MYHPPTRKPYELVLVVHDRSPEEKSFRHKLGTINGLELKRRETKVYPDSATDANCTDRLRATIRRVLVLGDPLRTVTCLGPKKADIINGAPTGPPACFNFGTDVHNPAG